MSLIDANTLGVPSVAEQGVTVRHERALVDLVGSLGGVGRSLTVLGGGSNVVLRGRVPGVVCLMRNRGIRLETETGGARITVAAGERWHDLVRYTLGRGMAGLENLALIPGAVGAAPIQNIGAYGVELAERFVSLRALDVRTGRIHVFTARDCRFGYRDSRFKQADGAGFVILDVTLRLHRRAAPNIDYPDVRAELARLGFHRPTPPQVAEAVIRVRRRKLPDPRRIGNAGSFFKNPEIPTAQREDLARRHPGLVSWPGSDGRVKLSAAQLIEVCGWKGRTVGSVGVWPRQPLVLVNRGGATGADVLAVGEDIRCDVAARFGIHLEMEPRVVGQD